VSRFGDRDFMNDLSELLEDRAKAVGNRRALQELHAVVATHCEFYWPNAEPEDSNDAN
jgi:hypothetical protein